MAEIEQRRIEKESVKYIVDCARKSLLQLLNMEFYVHDKGQPFYSGHPAWMPDEEPKPSPGDSWAVCQVPIRRKSSQIDLSAVDGIVETTSSKDITSSTSKTYEESLKSDEDVELRLVYETKKTVSRQSTEVSELPSESDVELPDHDGVYQAAGDSEVRLIL